MPEPRLLQSKIVDVTFGKDVTIIEPANIYGCTLDDGVLIGPFVEVQRGVRIGKRTRIQSHSFVCELVTIGDDCFVAHGVMFINDLFQTGGPAWGQEEWWKGTTVGNNVSIGSNATLLPVTICDHVVIGAGAVVTKDISESGVYAGNPARRIRAI